MALRVAHTDAPEIGRSLAASPDRFSVWGVASIVAVIVALWLGERQPSTLGSDATTPLCLALLVFGLPHGSLDIAAIRHSARLGRSQVVATVLLYLGLAAAMYIMWHFAPVLALASFFAIASVHFAEDWADRLPPFFAVGTAVAVLTAPALLHHQPVADIFVLLTGQQGAMTIADLSALVAPVALIATVTGIGLMIRDGLAMRALETGAAIGGMVLLPPIMGFAIFFCLVHSPKHFAAVRAEVSGAVHAPDREAVLLTCAALGIAALIYATQGTIKVETKAIVACFVTLSVLTVPHMLVPHFVKK
jgi:beta-carotene 15,15'-dioxygenase